MGENFYVAFETQKNTSIFLLLLKFRVFFQPSGLLNVDYFVQNIMQKSPLSYPAFYQLIPKKTQPTSGKILASASRVEDWKRTHWLGASNGSLGYRDW
jgi:hypothetical protein